MLRSIRRSPTRTDASEAQFRALVDDHADVIYRVAMSVVRDEHLAEDIVQETIIKAWQHLPSWRGDGPVRGWILSIAHNTAVSYLRRMRDTTTAPSSLPDRAGAVDVERESDARADLERLRQALAGLDQVSRSIVVMRDLEGLAYQDIADALGLPLTTVKTRLLRARRELHRVVQGATT